MSPRLGFAPVAWPQTAEALGFRPARCGGALERGSFALRCGAGWLTLVDLASDPADAGPGALGGPGLWRVVEDGPGPAWAHDLPLLRGLERASDTAGAPSPAELGLLLDWALATREGTRPTDWAPPARDEVEEWLPAARLRARSGPHLAKGELVHGPAQLALAFPDLATVPEDLPAARRAWVEGLLLDVQRRWRLARLGVDARTRRVRAEVDLTGVPAVWARPLVQLSLEALVGAVAGVLAPLSFLVDAGAASRALDRHPYPPLSRSISP